MFSFFGMAYPWLLLLNIFFVLFWSFRKDRYFLFSLACIIMGWGHFTRFIGLNVDNIAPADESAYTTVMSYNIHALASLRFGTKREKSEKIDLFYELFEKEKPAILCVQEAGGVSAQFLDEQLQMPYRHNIVGKGTAIHTTFPIVDKGEIDFGTKINSCLWADLQIGASVFRVYSTHLQSNRVSSLADQVIQGGDLQDQQTWLDIGGMIGRVKRAAAIRAEQAELIAQHIAQSPHRVIVCGDFNDTPQSYTYRKIAEGLHDGFCQSGSGFGTTYAGSIPALRIDYILHDPSIPIGQHKILRIPLSDHYPVISKLRLKAAG